MFLIVDNLPNNLSFGNRQCINNIFLGRLNYFCPSIYYLTRMTTSINNQAQKTMMGKDTELL